MAFVVAYVSHEYFTTARLCLAYSALTNNLSGDALAAQFRLSRLSDFRRCATATPTPGGLKVVSDPICDSKGEEQREV
jgi:hypothetical protein